MKIHFLYDPEIGPVEYDFPFVPRVGEVFAISSTETGIVKYTVQQVIYAINDGAPGIMIILDEIKKDEETA